MAQSRLLYQLVSIYDLQREPENTRMQLVVEGNSITGYLLSYFGFGYPIRILQGSETATLLLIESIPKEEMILFVDPTISDAAKKRFKVTAIFSEDIMGVNKDGARLANTSRAKRLTSEDAYQLAELYSSITGEKENPDSYRRRIAQHCFYGVFSDDLLVSAGGTYVETTDGWILGGICTSRAFRNRGYATVVTSALTEEAQRETQRANLNVVSSNKPAIRVYQRLGYRKTGEWLFIDTGTGHKPLSD